MLSQNTSECLMGEEYKSIKSLIDFCQFIKALIKK